MKENTKKIILLTSCLLFSLLWIIGMCRFWYRLGYSRGVTDTIRAGLTDLHDKFVDQARED